ncbi:hypothetical protein K503DRAFT_783066 [Rhizopogon vinicolor AM-OR11-026]|uniref:C2H2-type domain-containing protein n=1 Tax=Rhizopogon vinicolor AM-OR11-026 TaxID=1314800 RepID=A0A1B7N036_9AGAM|nr:hypothetical protein K503DRAFT_783066 [Rhizopogon vinicolor AM-OR11-026]
MAQSASADHSLSDLFQCKWDDKDGFQCNDLFYGNNFSAHVQEAHQIIGGNKARVRCQWNHCGMELNLENLARHVKERHLGIALRCDICGRQGFSRRDTLHKHRETCSGS